MIINQLREGVTTGTCATAAALASVMWQVEKTCPEAVIVDTPAGKSIRLEINKMTYPWCNVIKDAGDDPDVTNGCHVCVSVDIEMYDGEISFIGGEGIGKITAPGLKLPVGEPAINPVPRQMMEDHVRKIIGNKAAKITVSIPEGKALAAKTFNPRLGIVDGISILGTSGIVRPMSEDALKESLTVELEVAFAKLCQQNLNQDYMILVPGNTGEEALRAYMGQDVLCVQMSNYVGYMLDECQRLGIKKVLIAGFAGKLVKLAADIMNTHSHVADGRREIICTYAALCGAQQSVIKELFDCKTVQKTIEVIKHYQLDDIWYAIADAAVQKCKLRTGNEIEIGLVLFDKDYQVLGESKSYREVFACMN